MSGRGRTNHNGRGHTRGGRGSGRTNRVYNNNKSNDGIVKKTEKIFEPYYVGKQQVHTYDSVKEYIVNYVQKEYEDGLTIAVALEGVKTESEVIGNPPIRESVELTAKKIADEISKLQAQQEQEGFDLEYKENLKEFRYRKNLFFQNKAKAYALIINNYCNKV